MKTIKVSEAIGDQLNWMVCKAMYPHDTLTPTHRWVREGRSGTGEFPINQYSTDWAQGGPIIDREGIHATVEYSSDVFGNPIARCGWRASAWNASTPGTSGFMVWGLGETILVAAMRCYVASKLGYNVEVPNELE
jgi:hypothetical protein